MYMNFIYEIAGARILCRLPFEITVQTESVEFMRQDDGSPCDLQFDFQPVDTVTMPERYHAEINSLFCGRTAYFCPAPGEPPYARVIRCGSRIVCEYVAGMEHRLNYSRNICDLLQLEVFLLFCKGILLHSSFICYNGSGVLFSAPSGTGKSTQAALWQQFCSADVINGDRAGLRRIDGRWTAFGLPYAGSSGIYRNESAPLAAIVVLRQAKENRIRRLSPLEAVKQLLPEISSHGWDRDYMAELLPLVSSLVDEVPVFMLECLPDEGAVNLTKSTIFKEIEE